MVDRVEVGQRSRVARLVLPGLKVHDLGSADTEEDSQNFQAGYLLSQCRVETGPALFNIAKVKSRRESNRFDVVAGIVRVAQFIIVSKNRRMQAAIQTWNCVRKCSPEIRVGGAAVAGPPGGIYRELLKVRKPPGLRDERDLAGLQPGELPQGNMLLA